jgi:hypothetical protein
MFPMTIAQRRAQQQIGHAEHAVHRRSEVEVNG